jgi:hypothetical protein
VERYRSIWEERFDRLDAYLRDIQQQETKKQRTRNKNNGKTE